MVNPHLQKYLEGFLSTARLERLKDVLNNRTRHAAVVLEDIYQPQNASAVVRSVECLGTQDLYVIEHAFKYTVNKQIVRGANKWLNIQKFAQKETATHDCIAHLKTKGYHIVATSPGEKSQLLTDLDVTKKTAFIFGTEKFGVSKIVLDACDQTIKIPMAGFTESYNLSVSVGICLFHFMHEVKKNNVDWQLSDDEKKFLLHEWTKKAVKNSKLLTAEFFTKHGGKI